MVSDEPYFFANDVQIVRVPLSVRSIYTVEQWNVGYWDGAEVSTDSQSDLLGRGRSGFVAYRPLSVSAEFYVSGYLT